MGRESVWKRLLWKELRESGGVIAITLAVPMVLFGLASIYDSHQWLHQFYAFSASAGTYMVVVLWAANKGDSARAARQFSLTHLPVKPQAFWAASFMVPAVVSALLGAWFGSWSGFAAGDRFTQDMLLGALELLVLFSFCYYFALVISKWFAMLIGVVHVLSGGTLIPMWWDAAPLRDLDSTLFMGSTALGAFAGCWVFIKLSGRKALQARQALSLLTMVVVAFLPAAKGTDIGFLTHRQQDPHAFDKQDYSLNYSWTGTPQEAIVSNKPGLIVYHDLRTDRNVPHKFSGMAIPLHITDAGKVFVAEQPADSDQVLILGWDTKSGKVKQLATIPASKKAFRGYGGASVDPDGRYLLICLSSLAGTNRDLWFADLYTGRAHIVKSCGFYMISEDWRGAEGTVTWLADRVYVSGVGIPLLKISFKTGKALPVELPVAVERSRS